ncbi:MAG: response regulator [Ktedonobacterales bacterium]
MGQGQNGVPWPPVLVVDDDEPTRQAERMLLEDAGYVVFEAADGIAALELLRQRGEPCVVVLDMVMPRLDGAGVIRAVALDRKLRRRTAIILLTARRLSLQLALSRMLTALATPVILKPFDIDMLLEAVALAHQRLASGKRR